MDTGCAVDGVRPAAAAPNVLESYDIQRSLEPSEASTRRFSLEIFLHVLVHFPVREMAWKAAQGRSTRYPPRRSLEILRRHVQSSFVSRH